MSHIKHKPSIVPIQLFLYHPLLSPHNFLLTYDFWTERVTGTYIYRERERKRERERECVCVWHKHVCTNMYIGGCVESPVIYVRFCSVLFFCFIYLFVCLFVYWDSIFLFVCFLFSLSVTYSLETRSVTEPETSCFV